MNKLAGGLNIQQLETAWLIDPDGPQPEINRPQFFAQLAGIQAVIKTAARGERIILATEKLPLFLSAYVAALDLGLEILLPVSLRPEALQQLAHQYPRALLVTDESQQLNYSPQLSLGENLLRTESAMETFPIPALSAGAQTTLFTSGSTGQPRAQTKTWQQLCVVSASMAERLQLDSKDTLLVTVSAQHMFGFEAQVLLPLTAGLSVYCRKLFFPADVHSALSALRKQGRTLSLFTTPLQLRALLKSGLDFTGLRQIICSTAPLSTELVVQAENSFLCPVIEIFGSTEMGSIASRRTALESSWQLYRQVQLKQPAGQDKWQVVADYIDAGFYLDDRIELEPTDHSRFRLLGRADDLIKIAGKRHSLMALNTILQDIEGVNDGVFFKPLDKSEAAHLGAMVVAPDIDASKLRRQLQLKLDPVFLPRPLYFIEQLPRDSRGKISMPDIRKLAVHLSGRQTP